MNLDESQRKKVAEWIGQGLKLSEIQSRIHSELGLRPTYMEVRLLVDDLKLVPKDIEPPKPSPPRMTLNGIVEFSGRKFAAITVAVHTKPGAKAAEQAMTLMIGQRQGEIEVLDIDEKAGIVKVNYSSTVINLTWGNNGLKIRSAPTPIQPAEHPPADTARSGSSPPIPISKPWPAEVTDPDHQTLLDAIYKQKNAEAIANGIMPDVPGDDPLVPNNTPVCRRLVASADLLALF